MTSVRFENRDFTDYVPRHWETVAVQKFTNTVFGRAKKAKIVATGSRDELWEFAEMLRNPVYILDDRRKKDIWWGFVNRATIYDGGPPFSISLDNMANRIAIMYSYQNQRFTTAWAQNAESDAEFGQKEMRLTAREKSEAMAQQMRATELENRKYPMLEPAFRSRSKKVQAVLGCVGWMKSLGWQYYDQDEGNEVYEDFGVGEREIGEDDRPTAAQGFKITSAAGWNAYAIWLRVRKVGAPADNFQVALWDDNAGLPNAEIEACAVLAGGSITESYVWYQFILDSEQALALATQYWIHVSRSAGVDADNFYMIDANRDQGYANGNLFIKPAGAWYDKKMDALFRVVGEEATTAQITDIVSDAGEFFLGTDIINASGVNSTMYRAGDQTALYEINELLKTGTTNSRRLLAEVTKVRNLRVYEEPARYAADYSMLRDGTILDENDNIIPPQDCPVGVWMSLKEYIPATVDASRLIQSSPIFVEEAEYDAVRDEYRILKTRSGVSAAESLTRQIKLG